MLLFWVSATHKALNVNACYAKLQLIYSIIKQCLKGFRESEGYQGLSRITKHTQTQTQVDTTEKRRQGARAGIR